MISLTEYHQILNFLYGDERRYIEEISIIENMYLYPDIEIYVDDPGDIKKFLILQKNRVGNYSVFLHSAGDHDFTRKAFEKVSPLEKSHLQTGDFEKRFFQETCNTISSYRYLIMCFRSDKFTPVYKPVPLRITPDMKYKDLNEISHGNGSRFREQARHGVFYAVRDNGAWAALGGSGVWSYNYCYLFVDTETQYRGRGYARAVLSYAIRDILNRGKKPVYALDPTNEPSLRLARRLGFVPYTTRECFFIGKWSLARTSLDSLAIPDSSFYI